VLVAENFPDNQAVSAPTPDSTAPKSWRSVLLIHPAADLLPLMSGDELRALSEDIKENGLQTPITVGRERVEETGEWSYRLLDGRNRLDAIELAGFSTIAASRSRGRASRRREGMDCGLDLFLGLDGETAINHVPMPDDPYAYVVSANIHRRHLKPEQRQGLLIKLVARAPEKSDRQIAKEVGVDHKTVASARAKGEDVGKIPHVETRTDTKGRKQPAKKAAGNTSKSDKQTQGHWPPAAAARPPKKTRPEEAKSLDADAEAFAAKLVTQLDDATARVLHRQLCTVLYTGELLWRLAEALGRKLKAEGFDADEGNGVDPEASAEAMKAAFARADSEYLDPGPLPEYLRRKPATNTDNQISCAARARDPSANVAGRERDGKARA